MATYDKSARCIFLPFSIKVMDRSVSFYRKCIVLERPIRILSMIKVKTKPLRWMLQILFILLTRIPALYSCISILKMSFWIRQSARVEDIKAFIKRLHAVHVVDGLLLKLTENHKVVLARVFPPTVHVRVIVLQDILLPMALVLVSNMPNVCDFQDEQINHLALLLCCPEWNLNLLQAWFTNDKRKRILCLFIPYEQNSYSGK